LSSVGIATAVATVVLGRFSFDAVNRLVAVHFDSAQREDVTVLLHQAGGVAALHELARLPGVLRAEPFRAVPVRLRFDHLAKRSAILGVAPDADLRQLVDAQRRRIDVPPRNRADAPAGAALGATGRQTRSITTAPAVRRARAVVGRPLISGYMDARAGARSAVQRHLRGAAADRPRARAAVCHAQAHPAVSGVASAQRYSPRSDSMNHRFILMTVVMTGFAAVLVVGVVYNSARIALSERGNELASLRVLGYSTLEVTLLLLGEQAVLVLAAVPVGFGLGAAACRLLVPVFDRELFRLPFVLSAATFGFAALVTLGAGLLSAYLVVRRIARLDLVATIKSRE
jgi:putative ABC transport system permease protein